MEKSVPKRRHIKFRRRGISQQKTYKKSKQILCSNPPGKSWRLWDNVEKYDRTRQDTDDNMIRRMLCLSLLTKDTHTHTHTHTKICNIYCFSPAKIVTRTRLNLTFCLLSSSVCMHNQDMDPLATTCIMYLQRQALFKWHCAFTNNTFLSFLGFSWNDNWYCPKFEQ
jgi:hypothetical protein